MSPVPFHVIFHIDKMIMKIMSMEDPPWNYGNHHYILFLELETIESYQWILNPSIVITIPPISESTRDAFYDRKLGNISPTIPLDISINPGTVENVHIGQG
jgi:hypothetical protein